MRSTRRAHFKTFGFITIIISGKQCTKLRRSSLRTCTQLPVALSLLVPNNPHTVSVHSEFVFFSRTKHSDGFEFFAVRKTWSNYLPMLLLIFLVGNFVSFD
jgi:hypothetical protein